MSFLTQSALAAETDFRAKVKIAMFKAAIAVMAEDVGTKTAEEYSKRCSFASNILRAYSNTLLDEYANAIVTNGTITSLSSDNDIEFTVNSMFNAMAGVSIQDQT